MLSKLDGVETFTAKKQKYFHFDKEKREEKNSKKMRLVSVPLSLFILLFSNQE